MLIIFSFALIWFAPTSGVPTVWYAAVAVPNTGNCADLPLVIVRTECSCSLKMLFLAKAVRTSPEKILLFVILRVFYLLVLHLYHWCRSDYIFNPEGCKALLEALLSFLSASSLWTFQLVYWLGCWLPLYWRAPSNSPRSFLLLLTESPKIKEKSVKVCTRIIDQTKSATSGISHLKTPW